MPPHRPFPRDFLAYHRSGGACADRISWADLRPIPSRPIRQGKALTYGMFIVEKKNKCKKEQAIEDDVDCPWSVIRI